MCGPQRAGKYFTLKEHDSVRIDPERNRFWRNSTGATGTIIDFSMEFEGSDIQTTIQKLRGRVQRFPTVPFTPASGKPKKEKSVFTLPERGAHQRNVFAYLSKTRKIDPEIIQEFLHEHRLYQDPRGNCVFVSHDDQGNPEFGCIRGTNTDPQKRFRKDVEGSDYDKGFYINNGADTLIITESVIDAASLMTLYKQRGIEWNGYNYLATSGVSKTRCVTNQLQTRPEIKRVILALDNDDPGHLAAGRIREELGAVQWAGEIEESFPAENDWNEHLVKEDQKLMTDNESLYYTVDEAAARRVKEANSFSDYIPGSATAEYRQYVDEAIQIARQHKMHVDPMHHEKIDRLLRTYCRRLAENMNNRYAIDSRVPSVMIAGPANFPARKKEKQNAARDRNFGEWQETQGLLDKIRSTGLGGISADDQNAVSKLQEKLGNLEQSQETMKAVNDYYRKHKTLDGCTLLSENVIDKVKTSMTRSWRQNSKPFESYALTNNGAEIRRVKARIEELQRRDEAVLTGWKFEGGWAEVNKADNRLQIFFDSKPDASVRAELKSNGFRWAPSVGAWQRQLGANAFYAANHVKSIQPLTGETPAELQRRAQREAVRQQDVLEHAEREPTAEYESYEAAVETDDEVGDFIPRVYRAQGLPDGWEWRCYDDESGGLTAPDGSSFVSYDLQTKEYRLGDGVWRSFRWNQDKPVTLAEFQADMEKMAQETVLGKSVDRDSEKIGRVEVELLAKPYKDLDTSKFDFNNLLDPQAAVIFQKLGVPIGAVLQVDSIGEYIGKYDELIEPVRDVYLPMQDIVHTAQTQSDHFCSWTIDPAYMSTEQAQHFKYVYNLITAKSIYDIDQMNEMQRKLLEHAPITYGKMMQFRDIYITPEIKTELLKQNNMSEETLNRFLGYKNENPIQAYCRSKQAGKEKSPMEQGFER